MSFFCVDKLKSVWLFPFYFFCHLDTFSACLNNLILGHMDFPNWKMTLNCIIPYLFEYFCLFFAFAFSFSAGFYLSLHMLLDYCHAYSAVNWCEFFVFALLLLTCFSSSLPFRMFFWGGGSPKYGALVIWVHQFIVLSMSLSATMFATWSFIFVFLLINVYPCFSCF